MFDAAPNGTPESLDAPFWPTNSKRVYNRDRRIRRFRARLARI